MRLLSKYIFMPLSERKIHGSTFRCLMELERTQWMPKDELKQMQEGRLQALIAHAYQNVPYYQRIFQERELTPGDIKTVDDLAKLPILTREDVKGNLKDLIDKNYDKGKTKRNSTGGTTGEPLRILKPKEQGWSWGAFYRGLSWHGCKPGDKRADILGASFDRSLVHKLVSRIGRYMQRIIFLSAFDLSGKEMECFVSKLRKFQPKIIIAYSSAVYILAKYINQLGVQDIKPKAVFTSAEKLYDHQRQTIKEAFGCDVFEYYGGGEVYSIAYECPEHQGYHISAENVILETIKDDGQPSHFGEMGRIIVTDLHNYVMPFIRYENGDVGILSDKTCACGRGLPLIESIEGRITDIIVCKDGFISSPILTTIFKNLPVRQYQIIQESMEEIIVKIIKGNEYSQKDTDYILGIMHKYTGDEMKIQVDFVDSIPLTKAGKRRVVISKVPVRFE